MERAEGWLTHALGSRLKGGQQHTRPRGHGGWLSRKKDLPSGAELSRMGSPMPDRGAQRAH